MHKQLLWITSFPVSCIVVLTLFQFSSNPSKFSSSSSSLKTENSSGNNNSETVISYTFPWGTESVETICNLGDVPVRKMEAECAHSFQVWIEAQMQYSLKNIAQLSYKPKTALQMNCFLTILENLFNGQCVCVGVCLCVRVHVCVCL